MTPSWLLVLSLATALAPLAACGGKVVFDDGSGGNGNSAVVVGPSVVAASSTHSVGVTSSATGVTGQLDASLVSTQFFVDCKPEVPADPLGGSFRARYVNNGSTSASTSVSSAVLHVSGNPPVDYSFEADPPFSPPIPPGQSFDVDHPKKVDSGVGSPNVSLCNYCGAPAVLEVSWTNGQTATLAVDQLGCGF